MICVFMLTMLLLLYSRDIVKLYGEDSFPELSSIAINICF